MCFVFGKTGQESESGSVSDYFYGMQDQFMFGEALLAAPVIQKSQEVKRVYFPNGAQFYDFWTGKKIDAQDTWIEIEVERETIPL